MSAFSKTGLGRKSGTLAVGVALLGTLMLTACGPAAQTNDSAPNPGPSSSAAATTDAVKGVANFQSEAFDLDKQVSLDAKHDKETSILLGSGVVTQGMEGDKTTVTFTPYEGKDGGWKYVTDVALQESTSIHVKLMRWQDKSYIVVSGDSKASSEANGLNAAKNTTTEHVSVLDAATGKVVNTLTGDPYEVGAAPRTALFFNADIDVELSDGSEIFAPVMPGLLYAGGQTTTNKLVDPLTGQAVATVENKTFHNEAGFYQASDFYAAVGGDSEKTDLKGLFGNFALLATEQPVAKHATGSPVKNSKYSLVNTASKKVISEITCADTTDKDKTVFSPDFRYVAFAGNYVFDTQTGDAFCTLPVDNLDVRQFQTLSIDNEGNMYGTIENSEYARINIADTTKVETLAKDSSEEELPIYITDKGSAVFHSDNSDEVLVVVPAKN